jgi:CBS-domain-containing membrane protein
LFDKKIGSLVRAEDLTTPVRALLFPDDPAARALELLKNEADDCIPVVAREQPHLLLGVVRRNDVMNLLIRGHRA